MSAKTQSVLFSGWYAICGVSLALLVLQWGCFGEATTHDAVAVKRDRQDTASDGRQDQAPDEAWQRHEHAHRAWESKVAAWQEAQLRREQAEREQAKRDRVRQDEPYKVLNMPSPRYADGGPDVVGNIHRIIENASQNRQAYEQRVRERSTFGSPTVAAPAPSLNPSQSLDSLLQGMQRQQDLQLQEKLFGHHR
jgi:hypothetical protein